MAQSGFPPAVVFWEWKPQKVSPNETNKQTNTTRWTEEGKTKTIIQISNSKLASVAVNTSARVTQFFFSFSCSVTEKTKDLNKNSENLSLVEMRLSEYKAAALASKQDGQVNHTIQHWKVMRVCTSFSFSFLFSYQEFGFIFIFFVFVSIDISESRRKPQVYVV